MNEIRFVEDFRNQYKKKKEIWIIGSSPNLDNFPDDFFEGKISIGINWVFVAFPRCTHILTTHVEPPEYLLRKKPALLKKCILGIPLASRKKRMEIDALGKYKTNPVYFYWHWIQGDRKKFQKYLRPTIEKIMAKKPCKYICLKTNLHYAIQIAVVFGAKRIILAGCDARKIDGKTHANKRGLALFYPAEKRFKPKKWEMGIRLLAEEFKSHGIEIIKYSM